MANNKKVKKDVVKSIDNSQTETNKIKFVENSESALFIQRFAAFILDVFIVSMIASFISYPFLDVESVQKLSDSSMEVYEDYTNGKIDANQYISENTAIMYETAKKQGIISFVTILLNILYFIIFQIKNNGQTLGKQLLKIRVIDENDRDLSMNQMIFRSLIINSILIDMVAFGILIFSKQNIYLYAMFLLTFIQILIFSICSLMVMFRNDHRGIHDLIGHTKVMRCNVVKEMGTCEN